MANVITLGRGFEGNDFLIQKDNRTYLIDNIPFPKNGYIRKLLLSIGAVGEPIKFQILRRNKKGKLKLRSSQKLTVTKVGIEVFSVKKANFKAVKVTKKDFIAIRIPRYGSLINFVRDINDRIYYKRGNWNSGHEERKRDRVGLKCRLRVVEKKHAFQKNNGDTGDYIFNTGISNIQIGDFTKSSFNLSFKSLTYDENCFFHIHYKPNTVKSLSVKTEDGLISKFVVDMLSEADFNQAVIYAKDESTVNKNGGLEVELIINQKPDSNIIRFNLDHQGIEFFKQKPYDEIDLPVEDIALGVDYRTENEGFSGGASGNLVVSMPPEDVNSIAIYRANRTGIQNDEDDLDSFKIGHIERIKVFDSVGNSAWADQNINLSTGKYRIILPQDFLDTAVYPITIDPLIGYTTLGGSTLNINNLMIGNIGTGIGEGIVTTLYAGLNSDWDNTEPVKMAVYDVPQLELHEPVSDENTNGHSISNFVEFPLEHKEGTFIDPNEHCFMVFGGGNFSVHRDIGGVVTNSYYYAQAYGAFPPNPVLLPSVNLYSTYAAYVQQTPLNWGLPTPTVTKEEEKKFAMYQGGLSPNILGLAIRQVAINVNNTGFVTIALYEGGTLNDPTTAVKKTEFVYHPVVIGWNLIDVPNIPWIPNNPTWIGLVTQNGVKHRFTDQPTDRGDFDINGRWEQDTPADYDETQPLPINPGAGEFSDNRWIHAYIVYTVDFRITGTIDTTFEEMTMDAEGFKGVTGTIDTTFEEMTMEAEAIKEIQGIIDTTLEEMGMDALGTPIKEGIIDSTFEPMIMESTGQKIIYGTIDTTFEEMDMDAQGTPLIQGQMIVLLEEMTMDAIGEKEIHGEMVVVLEEMTMDAEAIKEIQGIIDTTLEEMGMESTGINYSAHSGTIDTTFEPMEMDAIGNVATKTKGTIDTTFEPMEMDAIGTPVKEGVIDSTLEEMEMEALGTPIKEGVIDTTLEEMEMDAIGTPVKEGVIDSTFEEMEMDAIGEKLIQGHMNVLLEEMTMDARGGRDTHGVMDVTFEAMEMTDGYGLVLENPISIELIEYGLVNAIKCVFDGEVIIEDQDGVGPIEPFISLRIQDLTSLTFSDPNYSFEGDSDVRESVGDRPYIVVMTAWSKNGKGISSMEVLENVKTFLGDNNGCHFLTLAKTVFIEAPQILNLSQIDGIRNVNRAQLVATFRTWAQYRRNTGHITQVNMTNVVNSGNSSKEIYTEIKE